MNIVSVMMGMTIMGASAPMILNLSIAPVEAAKRAENFGVAETQAVAFAANYEGTTDFPEDTDTCTVSPEGSSDDAFAVTCKHGQGKYEQEVTRAFRLRHNGDYTNPLRSFAFTTPGKYSHIECPVNDPWGVMYYNEHLKAGHLDACLPSPIWSEARYLESNPDDWLYDLSDHGYGRHPDF